MAMGLPNINSGMHPQMDYTESNVSFLLFLFLRDLFASWRFATGMVTFSSIIL